MRVEFLLTRQDYLTVFYNEVLARRELTVFFFYLEVSGIVIFCNLLTHQALRYFRNSFKCAWAFQIELEVVSVGF